MTKSTKLPVLPLREPFGRLASYRLRVSLLEQCQFRCLYCLPGAVNPYTPRADWLSVEEHARLAPFFAQRGAHQIRFTGGEPLLRDDVADIIAAWRAGAPEASLALTTNAQRLGKWFQPLKDAGLERLTIHIDSLDPTTYARLMGEGAHPNDIIELAKAAKDYFGEVKLNVVAQKGENDHEFPRFIELSSALGVQVRFIELMNTGSAGDYVKRTFMTGKEIRETLGQRGPVVPLGRAHQSDPAALYRDEATGVTFGVIASDSEPFCGDCNRLRLTAQGRLRGCLYEAGGVPLGPMVRANARDAVIEATLDSALGEKRSHHPLAAPHRAPFSMADVGG